MPDDLIDFQLPDQEQYILRKFMAFSDYFCVDWFADDKNILPSQLISTISFLTQQQWIHAKDGMPGFYKWAKKCPREKIIHQITPQEMSQHYREAVNVLSKHLPENEENFLKIAGQCLLAGIEEGDMELIFKAAAIEEKHHKISAAIDLYDYLLEFIETLVAKQKGAPSHEICAIFIKAIERRATLSSFHPNVKKINRFLLMALDMAMHIKDTSAQASIQLSIGQNYWMLFQHEKAVKHFDQGWKMLSKGKKDELYKRGLQLQGLSYWIKGKLSKAIQSYEDSIGELDSVAADDFSLLTALQLSFCYTQAGMPQRGLGISETIYNQACKNENRPLVAWALATMGIIFLEIGQKKSGKMYLEKALELSRQENIPMAEVAAGIGLANIECLEGNFAKGAEYLKVIWKLRKSSWYHILNSFHAFASVFTLHREGVSPIDFSPLINYLYQLKKEQINPFSYAIIRRGQIQFLEEDKSPKEKIEELKELENLLENCGAEFELAKIRIDLASRYLQTKNWQQAETHGRKAWEHLRHIARNIFPQELEHLIPHDDLATDDRLFDLVIEMGEALTNHKSIEQLLTNVITSISRLTGAERTALFIKDKDSRDIRMVASRNLMKEHIKDESFSHTMHNIRKVAGNNDNKIIQYEINDHDTMDFRRVIITPLLLGKNVIGALYQDSRYFSFDASPDKLKLLSALSSHIAVSIDRAQAYDEIARLNERLIQENRYYREEKEEFRPFGEIIGCSETISSLHNLIHKVAPTQSTVLIYGETGVGKELVARAIHRESARQNGPFIRVNCAALPETLIDSELFGHEKGAFTGAIRTKAGRFELAHRGTIFLDEVSELPLSTQSRLLRILQEKEFQRVGGTKTLHSDFRLITATNKDLSQEVAKGRFRTDLFYRLNVLPIVVPPLRERKEDIPPLVAHFLRLFSAQYNRHYDGIPESELEKIMAYSWPGNIRELANMVERAVILGGPKIRFPELVALKLTESPDDNPLNLKEMEKMQILKALKKANGKIGGTGGASAILGLKRTTLINRMKKLQISISKYPTGGN
jgi:transcriptional regulator with GAF, ATPase, and Fis domain